MRRPRTTTPWTTSRLDSPPSAQDGAQLSAPPSSPGATWPTIHTTARTVVAPDGTGANDLTLTGTVQGHESVAEFMARLSVIPEVTSVRLKEAGISTNDPNRVAFTIVATLRKGP